MPNISQTVQDIYQNFVGNLSVGDRLHLAALILNNLTQQEISAIDISDTWTEQDQHELASFSIQYANSLFPDEEGIV
ncbi:hypothetical protein [Altericista sp. CCNU0014]|uniref:hypothetical protein n=1 Tax=Altericista sp. CCNU0014 TaxID=3082949 RepID=UPI00384AAAED